MNQKRFFIYQFLMPKGGKENENDSNYNIGRVTTDLELNESAKKVL